jgi:hypothetical protein
MYRMYGRSSLRRVRAGAYHDTQYIHSTVHSDAPRTTPGASQRLHILRRALLQAPLHVRRERVEIVERMPRRDRGRHRRAELRDDRVREQAPARRARGRRARARAQSVILGAQTARGGCTRVAERGEVREARGRGGVAEREEARLERPEQRGGLQIQLDVVGRQRGRFAQACARPGGGVSVGCRRKAWARHTRLGAAT